MQLALMKGTLHMDLINACNGFNHSISIVVSTNNKRNSVHYIDSTSLELKRKIDQPLLLDRFGWTKFSFAIKIQEY